MQGFQFTIAENDEAIGRIASELIVEEMRQKPSLLLCAASGASPTSTYQSLKRRIVEEPETFQRLRLVALDEWIGLPAGSPASCASYLRHHVLTPLVISPDRALLFDSAAEPTSERVRVRDQLTHMGPIDVCVLGLGLNGHVGFNEPAAELQPFLHIAILSESSRRHPMLASVDVPVDAGFTLGFAEILQARLVILLVSGRHKAPVLRQFLSCRVTPKFPASFLWLHPALHCIVDRDACPDRS